MAALASETSLCFYVIFRYLRRLHFSLKKGRWNPKEEEKLTELIEKHGVGKARGTVAVPGSPVASCSRWTFAAACSLALGLAPRPPPRSPAPSLPSSRQVAAVSPLNTGSRPRRDV